MKPLPEREAEMRRTLDPTLSMAEVEEQVADWLRRQPEARQENIQILRGKLVAAQDVLLKAEEAAHFLGWPSMVEGMGQMRATLGQMRQVVGG